MRILTMLIGASLALVILAVVLAIGAKITTNVGDTLTGTAKDVTLNGTLSLADLGEWMPTIAIILAAVVIISLLLFGFGGFLRGGGGF